MFIKNSNDISLYILFLLITRTIIILLPLQVLKKNLKSNFRSMSASKRGKVKYFLTTISAI